MKKILFVMAGAAALVACNRGKAEAEQMARERDSLAIVIGQRDEQVNDLVRSINEIQEGFQRLNEAEGRITVAEGGIEGNSARDIMRENIAYMQETMAKNREMIARLERKVREGAANIKALQTTLALMQKQLEEKGARIQELEAALAERDAVIERQEGQIANLSDNVEMLSAENERKAQTVAAQDKDLHKAWFVFGTKAELKSQKILSGGDVLREGDFNRNYFTEVDIRAVREIKLYSKKAELLTTHPAGTYRLAKDQRGEYVLHITDTKKFWSVSRYLVIQVK